MGSGRFSTNSPESGVGGLSVRWLRWFFMPFVLALTVFLVLVGLVFRPRRREDELATDRGETVTLEESYNDGEDDTEDLQRLRCMFDLRPTRRMKAVRRAWNKQKFAPRIPFVHRRRAEHG